ncbi:short chain dehydrogenase [Listeria newyorkensis]|uniref:Short chain dehydrogenase n=1 Tax=Listeria newyorkensis TaxID=1497681 RepID=A0ABX4XRY9_9LIST|nr:MULTISPECIES: short chain dehydrogenase [Listeria]KGL39644.1 short-chain dehydrogenase [Listeriaceae bacterium FSL A5-0209]KGL44018.1 short-chain dehydrogenase [Listeria newyorkensis]PNP94853.1 short chain dehydrogenase [Listeria newyorkensis]RQW67187.1 short chain dehydrogenase [Listeria sp. SHR_NRA_18]WAO21801.1 short chain dehydrogenase [Listeria newyorkensis]
MKIVVVGATGTIGKAIVAKLEQEHTVIMASRKGADVAVDMTSPASIQAMYEQVGKIDALVVAAGAAYFGPLTTMTPENNEQSIDGKLKGQMNLVLLGLEYLNDGGSFTLVTGIMMDDPIKQGASAAMVNGGIRSFVKSAAIEMPRGIRINSVSPNVLQESWDKYADFFVGFNPVPAERVAQAFVKSILGGQTGQNYEVY